jgi:hypothetical protein
MASFDMMLTAPRTILFVGATSVGSVPEKCKSARSGFWDPTEYRPLLRCLESGTISINWPRGFPRIALLFLFVLVLVVVHVLEKLSNPTQSSMVEMGAKRFWYQNGPGFARRTVSINSKARKRESNDGCNDEALGSRFFAMQRLPFALPEPGKAQFPIRAVPRKFSVTSRPNF